MSKYHGDDAKPRLHRSVAVMHSEAFQIMLYVSKQDGVEPAWFWNSRDGVTPYGTLLDGIEYRHAIHGYPTAYSAVLPVEVMYVWVDYTPDSWRRMLHRRWELSREHPATEFHNPEEFVKRWPTAESFEFVEPFRQGEPRQITRQEFLESTFSWHGRKDEE